MKVTNKQPQPNQVYFVAFTVSEINEKTLTSVISNTINSRFFSIKQKIGRILLNLLLGRLPTKLEIGFVSYIKKNVTKKVYISPSTFFIARLTEETRITLEPQYPGNRQFYLGLTFDIDYKQDYERLPYFIEDLVKYDVPATINLVTHADYTVPSSFISDLQKSGFEIGLHGDTHNTTLAFLPRTIIHWKLQRAIDKLGFLPFGYRSPGLSYSRNLVEVLDELGFWYDSSLTTGISRYKSLEFPYVFQHTGLRIVEVPLFMQDYNFFVNDLYSEQEAIKIFETQIAEIAKIGGIALLNLHPLISFDKKVFWQALLELMEYYKSIAYISTLYHLLEHR